MTPLAEEERQESFDEIRKLIRQRQVRAARDYLTNLLDPDVGDLLKEMTLEERLTAFSLLPKDRASDIFTFLPSEQQEELLDNLKGELLTSILNEMEPDDRAFILEDLPDEFIEKLLSVMRPEERKHTEELMSYPPETVGRIYTPHYISLRAEWTVGQALAHIREKGAEAELLNMLFVVDPANQLIDDLPLRKLILANPEDSVKSLLDGNYVALKATDDRETAVTTMGRYDMVALPVVNENNTLLGIVTFDDVADIALEETTEDFHKAGSVAPLATSYSEAGIWALFQKRFGWLIILVLVNLLSSGVIAAYEDTLASMIALAFFIPLLIDSGGNTGSQSAILLIRALATGDIKMSQWASALGKELLVGLILGLAMGLASSLLGLFRGGFEIGLIVGLSMMAIVLVANLIGAILPFLLTKLGIDPAVAGSPLITSIADTVGLLIYFSIATMVLAGGVISA
jgi:magnesium transporter